MAEERKLTANRRSRQTGGQRNGDQRLSKVKNQRQKLGAFSKGKLPETLLQPEMGDRYEERGRSRYGAIKVPCHAGTSSPGGVSVFGSWDAVRLEERRKEKLTYLENLKQNASQTRTLNGAKTWSATGNACLDLFAVAGGMRHRREQDLKDLFNRAYIENPDLAMKLLFYIRDIRGGLGEREMFRTLIRHVAKTWPASAEQNVDHIPEYGRYDDLLCLMGTSSQKEVVRLIRDQLAEDEKALQHRAEGETDAHISLLAKWLPSVNTSSARTRGRARVLMNALGMHEAEYRKKISRLRSNIGLTEKYLTAGRTEKIRYEAVPAGAMIKYRGAFEKKDGDRFSTYLAEAACHETTIHSGTLYPYEITRPFFRNYGFYPDAAGRDVLDLLWENLAGTVKDQNAICVVDTSGSMFCSRPGTPMPALIALSLGLYYAQHARGVFHNLFMTFSARPRLVEVKGKTLWEKLMYMSRADWGWNTDLEAVFNLLLETAVRSGAPQEDMPSTLYIISDMEFDCCVADPDQTVYENAKKRFEEKGYRIPAVVFHNVNSWQMQTPVRAKTKGVALTSGAGTASFSQKFDGNITPLDHMLRVLNSDRYKPIRACES